VLVFECHEKDMVAQENKSIMIRSINYLYNSIDVIIYVLKVNELFQMIRIKLKTNMLVFMVLIFYAHEYVDTIMFNRM
jgi:hypothetical protein